MCICSNHLVSLIRLILPMYASFVKLYMASNKPLLLGILNEEFYYLLWICQLDVRSFPVHLQSQWCYCLLFWFMLMNYL